MDGVGEVNVYAPPLSMRVWLDANKITALNLPVSAIQAAIESQNIQPSLGKVGSMPGDGSQQMVYALLSSGRINDVEEFKQIIVRTDEEGGLVRLGDVARIEIGQEDYNAESQFDGAPSVAIAVNMLSGANAINAMSNLRAEMARLEQFYPDDMEIFVAYDATEYITSSIEEVVFTLILTFAGLARGTGTDPDHSGIHLCHFCRPSGAGLQPKYPDPVRSGAGDRPGG